MEPDQVRLAAASALNVLSGYRQHVVEFAVSQDLIWTESQQASDEVHRPLTSQVKRELIYVLTELGDARALSLQDPPTEIDHDFRFEEGQAIDFGDEVAEEPVSPKAEEVLTLAETIER